LTKTSHIVRYPINWSILEWI